MWIIYDLNIYFRDTLYRMSFTLKTREKSVWEASMSMMETCQNKGQSELDCRNHIMVLQNYGNQLYACGTYAFSPYCSWRQVGIIPIFINILID